MGKFIGVDTHIELGRSRRSQENRDKGTGLSEIGDNQVPHQGGQQGIKPLPLLSFSLNFPSLRSGEMLAQYLNGRTL